VDTSETTTTDPDTSTSTGDVDEVEHDRHRDAAAGDLGLDGVELMRAAMEASGCDVVTVAVRRERLYDPQGRNLLDFIDLDRYTILPNTAGCRTVEEALFVARLGREVARTDLVKLEVIPDPKYLFPDPAGTLEAARILVAEGFVVLPYIHADPVLAKMLALPTLSLNTRREIVEQLVTALSPHPLLGNFLRVLAENDRLNAVADIANAYQLLVERALGRVRAQVRLAAPLSEDELNALVDAFIPAADQRKCFELRIRFRDALIKLLSSR
jgi:hypothetical protein